MHYRLASIRMKLLSIVLAGVAGMVLVMAISLFAERGGLLDDRKIKTRHLVETAHSLVQHYHAQQAAGTLDEAQAKQAALAALKALRYEKSEYFWVNDMHPRVVMHPIKPELDGKDVSGLKDGNGKYLFREFVAVAERDGAGFVAYLWPKPGFDDPQPKISYVQGFRPWGWVIGSGIYVNDVQEAFYRRALQIGGIVLLVSLLAAGLGWRVGRGIFLAIDAMRAAMQRVQASHDLSLRVQVARRDELGEMGNAFNAMIASFQDIIRQMIDGAGRVAQAAGALTRTTAHIAEASGSQSEAAMSTAAAVEEMTSSIALMAERATETDAAARRSESLSTEGGDVVRQSVAEMRKIAGAVQESSASISTLGQHSDQIAQIVGVIKEIADQTNLLALNAAIEAARAGEQGRGFAVVADEVRKLAERTARSTEEIATMIGTIQRETQSAVASMQQGAARVEEGVTMSERSHASMESIRSAAVGVKQAVGEISLALSEQRSASGQVSSNVEAISMMAERNSGHVREMAAEAAELERLAAMLQEAAGRFRT
jgi:methyl-accepting chemotaxis protein